MQYPRLIGALATVLLISPLTLHGADPAPAEKQPQPFFDDFESYADQAAFEAQWPKDGKPLGHLDTNFGLNSKHSVSMPDPRKGAGSTNRYHHELPTPLTPRDDSAVIFTFEFYLDPAGAPNLWSRAWHSVDIRGYADGHYNKGAVTGVVSIGMAPISGVRYSPEYYQGRIFAGEKTPTLESQYQTLNTRREAPKRSAGWHTLSARIGATTTSFYIDQKLSHIADIGITHPLTSIVIGSDVGGAGDTTWVDDIRVIQPISPPANAKDQ